MLKNLGIKSSSLINTKAKSNGYQPSIYIRRINHYKANEGTLYTPW